jgi:putative heme transporter
MLHEPLAGSGGANAGEDSANATARDRDPSPVHRTGSWRRPLLAVLVVAVLAIIIVFGRHTLGQSLGVLGTANLGWLLLALAAEVVSLTAFGLSRRGLLRANGHRISLRSVMAITYAGNALSTSVPFAGTELAVVYSYRQFRRAGVNAATTSWSLTVSWICSTSALALLLVAGAVAGGATDASAAGFAGAALYLLPGAGVLLALRFDRVRGVLHTVLAWLAGLSKRMFGKPENGAEGLDRFLDEVSSTRLPLPAYARVFTLAVANWLFDCAALACAIKAMGQPVPWGDLLLVYGAGAAAGSTGVTPGGFAIVELALTAALTASGLHASAALASVLAYRLVNFWLVLLGGWITMGFLTHPVRARRSGRRLISLLCPRSVRSALASSPVIRIRCWHGCVSAPPSAG